MHGVPKSKRAGGTAPGAGAGQDPGAADRSHGNLTGAALMIAGMAAYAASQALMRSAAPVVPFRQALFAQSLGVFVGLTALAVVTGQIRMPLARLHVLPIVVCALAEAALGPLVVGSLYVMGIGQVTAILQAAPLVVTLAAIVILGEPASSARIAGVVAGLAGVMVILRPGPEVLGAYMALPILAVIAITFRDLAARRIVGTVPPIPLALTSTAALTVVAGAAAAGRPWGTAPAEAMLKIIGSSACLVTGVVMNLCAVRTGDLSFVAQFRYSALLFALLIGWLVLGEGQGPHLILGGVLVAGAGLFTLAHERARAARAAQRAPSAPTSA